MKVYEILILTIHLHYIPLNLPVTIAYTCEIILKTHECCKLKTWTLEQTFLFSLVNIESLYGALPSSLGNKSLRTFNKLSESLCDMDFICSQRVSQSNCHKMMLSAYQRKSCSESVHLFKYKAL